MNRVSLSFGKLAPLIVGKIEHVNDGNYRTAISRLYYAVFLELRESYKRKLPVDSLYRSKLTEETSLVHPLVKLATFDLSKKAGEYLQELHEFRKLSDYEVNIGVTDEAYNTALRLYENVADFVKRIRSLQPNRVEKAMEKAYRKIVK